MDEDRFFVREAHLDQEHWGNIPDGQAPRHDYYGDPESRLRRERIVSRVSSLLGRIISLELTHRQQQVILSYFWENRTQVQIAQQLQISQPTVSQHLNGKKRGGKKVGGALRRIRKAIRTEAGRQESWAKDCTILSVLDGLMAENLTRRAGAELLNTLA